MFVIDDIVMRTLGIKLIAPFDTLATFEAIQEAVLKELYDPNKINNRLKEISLLLDRGEITKADFEKQKEDLLLQLNIAEKVKENSMARSRMDIKLM